jgi:hypothetical protein
MRENAQVRVVVPGLLLLLLALGAAPARADEPAPERSERIGRAIALYVPNRILDALDLLRAHVRFGPGVASRVSLTGLASATAGEYDSIYMGLHGPRGRPKFPSPIGFERYDWDSPPRAVPESDEPYYGPGEIGVGFQLGFFGLDVGVDLFEFADLALGIFLQDPVRDDF